MNDAVPSLDRDRLAWMYRQMLRIREFEERVKATFTEHPGVIRGHTHLADGAEASIVGSLATLRPGDQVMATYRCHGYPLVLGSDPNAIMAEIYGRATGLCGGYGGSMHLADPSRGFLGTSGIVGQGIPQATAKTGRLVLADQATRHSSAAAVIAAEVADQGFASLKAPVKLVTALDATVPYSKPMEEYILPDESKIVFAAREVLA